MLRSELRWILTLLALTPFLIGGAREGAAQAQAQLWNCGSEQEFFSAIYAPGWDDIYGYTSEYRCHRTCQGLRNCSAHDCVSIGYCVALHAPGSSSGGGCGPALSNLPPGSA